MISRVGMAESKLTPLLNPRNLAWLPKKKTSKYIRILVYIKQFCSGTYIHGWKYLTDLDLHKIEKFIWACVLTMDVCLLFYMVGMSIISYNYMDPLMVLEKKMRPISDIPFPAITICPDNQIRPSFFPFRKYIEMNLSSSDIPKRKRDAFDYAMLICDYTDYKTGSKRYFFKADIIRKIMEKIQGIDDCRELISHMKLFYSQIDNPCESHIQPMVSTRGACFSLNMLAPYEVFRYPKELIEELWGNQTGETDWVPDKGFWKTASGIPWKVEGARNKGKLVLVFNLLSKDFDGICTRGGQGLYVYIHNPMEMPSDHHQVIYLEPSYVTDLKITPDVVGTDEGLGSWNPENRGCFLDIERKLNFFNIYSQKNCETECEANITLKACGCLAFFHPRLEHVPVCGPQKLQCLLKALSRSGEHKTTCNCLPGCSEITYTAEVTSSLRDYSDINFPSSIEHNNSNSTITILKAQFRETYFIGLKRTSLMGFTDLLAQIGGLLGLLMGFSLITPIEFFKYTGLHPLKRE